MRNGKYNKSNKGSRVIVLLMALMLLVGSAIGGTLAWLISTANPVEDVFTYGNVTIALTEGDNTDNLWSASEHKNSEGVVNFNLLMIPGNTTTFNPHVKVASGSEDCYVFVKVVKKDNFDNFFVPYAMGDNWTQLDTTTNADVYWRVVSKTDVASESKWFPVIKDNTLTVKSELGNDSFNNAAPKLEISAYAIQKNYLNTSNDASAAEAWAALNNQLSTSNP